MVRVEERPMQARECRVVFRESVTVYLVLDEDTAPLIYRFNDSLDREEAAGRGMRHLENLSKCAYSKCFHPT